MERAMYHGYESELSVGQRAFLYQDRLCYGMLQKSRALSSFSAGRMSHNFPPDVSRRPSTPPGT